MKELFREHFKDYVKSELGLKLDSLSDVDRSKCMARFYAEKVIRSVNPGLIPTIAGVTSCPAKATPF